MPVTTQYWAICWRCGVDYDASKYLLGAPCEDCQLDVPGNYVKYGKRGRLRAAELAERNEMVKLLHRQRLTDPEIAEALGYRSRQAIQAVRKRFGLAQVDRPDKHLWKSQAAHAAHARRIGRENTKHVRGKKYDEQGQRNVNG
jgi:hypothetical protein